MKQNPEHEKNTQICIRCATSGPNALVYLILCENDDVTCKEAKS